MKYYVISDIHSHYRAMTKALRESDYNSNDKNHHLIVIGDLFDRGNETVEVMNYLHNLACDKKVTIILGNHDTFLIDFLLGNHEKVFFNIKHNGFGKTLEQLSDLIPEKDNLNHLKDKVIKRYPFLLDWLKSFPMFYEIGDYIFVHGGINGKNIEWRTTTSRRDFVWNREYDLPPVPNKIVVAGHHRVATIRHQTKEYKELFIKYPESFDILYDEGKILIDRFVEVSGEINVLTLDLEG